MRVTTSKINPSKMRQRRASNMITLMVIWIWKYDNLTSEIVHVKVKAHGNNNHTKIAR